MTWDAICNGSWRSHNIELTPHLPLLIAIVWHEMPTSMRLKLSGCGCASWDTPVYGRGGAVGSARPYSARSRSWLGLSTVRLLLHCCMQAGFKDQVPTLGNSFFGLKKFFLMLSHLWQRSLLLCSWLKLISHRWVLHWLPSFPRTLLARASWQHMSGLFVTFANGISIINPRYSMYGGILTYIWVICWSIWEPLSIKWYHHFDHRQLTSTIVESLSRSHRVGFFLVADLTIDLQLAAWFVKTCQHQLG